MQHSKHQRPSGFAGKRWGICAALILLAFGCAAPPAPLKIDGSTGVRPLVVALVEAYQKQYPHAEVQIGEGLNPTDRIAALQAGQIHIAMASHGLDIPAIEEDQMQVHLFAKVAVVFGVHADVPVRNLTEAQICGIYTGQFTNWEALGGPGMPIMPFARPESEVDTEVVREEIPCFKDLAMADLVQYRPKSGELADALTTTSGAIGMTTMVRVSQSDGQMHALALQGIAPTPENIQAQTYGLTRDSFLITAQNPPEAVVQFMAFLQTDAAKAVILANQAVPTQ